ncbi:hypothetical protein [Agromyces humi]|uniref:hypothetical protein n=1 Tax=Agromyces humi TaxID=1766800 RepID=UPI00135AFE82|nr:hypothetical protein [Agromyces humi]
MLASHLQKNVADRSGLEVSIPNIIVAIAISVAVLLAAVFGAVTVIPYTQDATTQSTLDAFADAEQISISKDGVFQDHQGLINAGYLQHSGNRIAATFDNDEFCAAMASPSGAIFWTKDDQPVPFLSATQPEANCPTTADVSAATVPGPAAAGPAAPANHSSVVEVKTSPLPGSTDTPIPLATPLVPSDVVVVVFHTVYIQAGTVTAPGLTFQHPVTTQATYRTNSYRHRVSWTTGATGPTTITVNPGGSPTNAVVYVLRGLNSPTLASVSSSTYGSTFATTKTTPAATAGRDQIAIFTAMSEGGAGWVFPAAPAPASGWQVDQTATTGYAMFAASNDEITTTGPISATLQGTMNTYMGVTMLVFGTPSP